MSLSNSSNKGKNNDETTNNDIYLKQDENNADGEFSKRYLPLVEIQREVEEMGKALKCPICQSTLDQPCLLSCIHAFCRDCIFTYYTKSARGAACCPICKAPIATKRSITPSDHLADIVCAFKRNVQAFGLAPIVYSPKATGILLTQLSSQEQEEDQPPSLSDCREHLSVSISMKESLLTDKPTTVEQQKKATFLIAAQEKVIQVDKRTLAKLEKDQIVQKNNPSWTLTQESATADAIRADEAVNQSLDWMDDEKEEVQEQNTFLPAAQDGTTHATLKSSKVDEPCLKRQKSTENKENAPPSTGKEGSDQSEMGNTVQYDDDNDIKSPSSPEILLHPNSSLSIDTDYQSCEYKKICELADQWYETKINDFLTKKTINIVISSLNDHFKDLVGVLVSVMKREGISVKIQNDIHPEKTSICITSSSSTAKNDGWYYSSQVRTLKSIRASLFGIPIVTPEWISLSLERKEIQLPKGNLCIRTLPCKVDYWKNFADTSAQFGVAKYAAQLQMGKGLLKPLQNAYICLCGMVQGPQKSDAQTIIRDSGAKLVSVSVIMRQLLLKTTSQFFVFLCSNDDDDGIAPHHKKICDAISSGTKVLVVGSAWLFDTVSCGTIIEDIQHYSPESPNAIDLWKKIVQLSP